MNFQPIQHGEKKKGNKMTSLKTMYDFFWQLPLRGWESGSISANKQRADGICAENFTSAGSRPGQNSSVVILLSGLQTQLASEKQLYSKNNTLRIIYFLLLHCAFKKIMLQLLLFTADIKNIINDIKCTLCSAASVLLFTAQLGFVRPDSKVSINNSQVVSQSLHEWSLT